MNNSRIVLMILAVLGGLGGLGLFAVMKAGSSAEAPIRELSMTADPSPEKGEPVAQELPQLAASEASSRRDAGDLEPAALSPDDDGSEEPSYEELREFRNYVNNALYEIRKEEAASQLKSITLRIEGLQDTMTSLDQRLSLSHRQSDRVRAWLLARWDLEAEYVRKWEQGADEGILDELKASDRKAQRKELEEILNSGQVGTFMASNGIKWD